MKPKERVTLKGHDFGGLIGFKPFARNIEVTFWYLETSYGDRLFAIENSTGTNITYLWNWVGYSSMSEALYDTTKVIMCFGGGSHNGYFYEYLKKRGNDSFIYKPKFLNFISLKLNNIIK